MSVTPCGSNSRISAVLTLFDLSGLDSVPTCSEPTRAGAVRVLSRSRLAAVRAIETASSASEGAKPRRSWPSPEVYLPAGAPSATSRSAWSTWEKFFFPFFFHGKNEKNGFFPLSFSLFP